jgi:cytochrome c oxidase subunit 4
MTDRTDVAEPGTEVEPAPSGGEVVAAAAAHPVPHVAHEHPGPRQYVLIAVVLVILTAFEVAASYLEGDVNANLLIFLLGVMAAMKFFLVAAWYMHMKMDQPFFRRLFVIGMVGASIVYGIVMLAFSSTVLKS